ncbi:hypothetical protein PIB30_097185, partial [Stylosanthes scabra]|nr:hypothetical protein [Stylosanthes scabra]
EKVIVVYNRPCIFLEGAGSSSTIIQWNDHDKMSASATFTSLAKDVVAKGITFKKNVINFTFGANGPKLDGGITAQKRISANSPTGYVFKECDTTGVAGKAELGRAYGPFARVIIADSSLSDVVRPEGWNAWNYVGHE